MAYLVSGNPGAGKSTLTAELVRRGVRALDSDAVDGLAAFMDASGAVVGDHTMPVTPELLAEFYWGWSAARLDEVLDDLGGDGVLLGIAVNQWDFTDRFDRLVLLELDDATQHARVLTRHPLDRQQIAAGLPVMQAQMIERGAARIDARQPTATVADELQVLLGL